MTPFGAAQRCKNMCALLIVQRLFLRKHEKNVYIAGTLVGQWAFFSTRNRTKQDRGNECWSVVGCRDLGNTRTRQSRGFRVQRGQDGKPLLDCAYRSLACV